jgi:hypothetical protein
MRFDVAAGCALELTPRSRAKWSLFSDLFCPERLAAQALREGAGAAGYETVFAEPQKQLLLAPRKGFAHQRIGRS